MDIVEQHLAKISQESSKNCGNCGNWTPIIWSHGKCNLREGSVLDDFLLKLMFAYEPAHKRCLTSCKHFCMGFNQIKIMTTQDNNIIHKVMINGFEYWVNQEKQLLYDSEEKVNKENEGVDFKFLTQNERSQIWNQVTFKKE